MDDDKQQALDFDIGALIEKVVAQRRRVATMIEEDPSKRTEKQLLRAMELRLNELMALKNAVENKTI